MSPSSAPPKDPARLAWGPNEATYLTVTQPEAVDKAEHGTPGLTKRSGMVSLDLPEGTVPLHPDGVDDHHITLAYLGSDVSDDQLEAALNLVRAAAPQHEPLTVRLGGVASFPPSPSSDGKVPAYVPVERSPELLSLREALADLDASGRPDWHPHVTLAYLEEGDPLPPPAPDTAFQAGHVTVHRGDRTWRVALGEAAVKKVFGVSVTPGGFIGKVGPEGYIHGFICVRPPCGKGDHAKVTRDASNGKVYLGEKGTGEYIGKIVKNSDGTYTARHNGHIIGGGKTLLQGKYADHQKAAVALGQYHSLRSMEKAAHDQGHHETASHLGAAATAHASGDAEGAVFNLHHAHQSSKAGSDLSHHISLLHQGMGGKPGQAPQHPEPTPEEQAKEDELVAAIMGHPKVPKPSAPSHPGSAPAYETIGTVHAGDIKAEFKAGQGTLTHEPTGVKLGTYTAHNGTFQIKHADGEQIPYSAGDSVKAAVAKYHNEWHAHKAGGNEEPPVLADWEKQLMGMDDAPASVTPTSPSSYVSPHDVTEQKFGAVTFVDHKLTGAKIGTYHKNSVTGKYDATHSSGAVINGSDNPDEALDALLAYHNDTLAHSPAGASTAPVNLKPVAAAYMATHSPSTEPSVKPVDMSPQLMASIVGDLETGTPASNFSTATLSKVRQHLYNKAVEDAQGIGMPDAETEAAYGLSDSLHPDHKVWKMVDDELNARGQGSWYKKPTPATGAVQAEQSAPKPTPWNKAGQVDVQDLSLKQNGDVVHKPTKTVIGHIAKQPNTPKPGTTTFTATHADGTQTHVGVYKGNAMATIALHHNAQLSAPSAPASNPYKAMGEIGNSDLEWHLNGADQTTTLKHKGDGLVVGTIKKTGSGPQTKYVITHGDGTEVASIKSPGKTTETLLAYHNEKYGASAPPKPGSVTAPPKPAEPTGPLPLPAGSKPWDPAGTHVTHADVTVKQNGDVVHKATKTKIGVLYKSQGNYWTAAHDDGQGFPKYPKKGDALDKLLSYHNQTTAIDHGVKPDEGGELANLGPVPNSIFYQINPGLAGQGNPDHLVQQATGKDFGALVPEDGGFKATLANGTSFHIPTSDKMKAKYNFLYAHNQAQAIAAGTTVPKLDAHPPLDEGTVNFSPYTKVGSPQAPLTVASPGVSQASAHAAATAVSHVKHEVAGSHTAAEKAAITKYTGSWYATVNSALAKQQLMGDQVPSGTSAAALHHALNKTELAHDTNLYRGIHDAVGMLGPVGSKVGTVGVQHSFMSTSTKEGVGKGFGHGGVLLTIHAPKGAKAMNVVNLSHYSGESEVLFQHGTMYRVNSDVIGPDGLRHADITIVGLSAKDGNHTVYGKVGASGE